MSFLPYAPHPPSAWVTAISGSTAAHGVMLAALFLSSVALLPDPSTSTLRAPEFEITLEIVDAEIIDLADTAVTPDTGVLAPVSDPAMLPDEVQDDGLAPTDDAALLVPDDAAIAPEPEVLTPVEEDFAALAPEPEVAPDLPELVDDAPVVDPEITPESEPVAPVAIPAAEEDLAIDDLSPIEDSVISPLAEGVAPAPPPSVAPTAPVAAPPIAEGPVAQAPEQETVPEQAQPVLVPEAAPVTETEVDAGEEVAAILAPQPTLPVPEPIAPEALVPLENPAAIPGNIEDEVAPATGVDDATPPAIIEDAIPEAIVEPGDDPDATRIPVQPDAENPDVPSEELAALIPEQPDTGDVPIPPDTDPVAPQIINDPSPSAQLIGALLQRIRNIPAPQCTIALPRRVGPDTVAVSFVGAEPDSLDTLATRVLDGLAPAPAQTREVLDSRQCAVLDAVRVNTSYPASRIGVSVEDTTLQSGDTLRARVTGAEGLYLNLLIVDDNGVVQDLARFTSLEDNIAVINAPVARAGDTRTTRQILLILGSPDAPTDLSATIGRTAQDVVSEIPRVVLEQLLFGLITFDVQ